MLLTVDVGNLSGLLAANLVQPIADAALASLIPNRLRDLQGRWFGFTKRIRAIAYAKDRVAPADVATMEALSGPKFKGKVCARASTNVQNLSLLSARTRH
jgi:iron(III) transport system substrate-binding protein